MRLDCLVVCLGIESEGLAWRSSHCAKARVNHSQTKSELRDRRAREVGRDPIILGLIGRQILSLTKTLNSHRHLNGADLRRWFGKHKLRTAVNRRDGATSIAA